MEFPVDVLVSGRHEDLESSAQSYMNTLLYSNPDNTQYLTLPNKRKIRISPANVGFVPLYGTNLKHKVLALFAPEDQFTAMALYLADQWYTVEDILRTSNPAREGIVKVRSVGERIVLYVLNRIIYRTVEMGSNEVPFLCHGEDVFAKILWKNGEAVGFYSVKSKGSLCNSFVSQCYLLPVMDSIFVRKDHRGEGHGLQMLEDFVDSFKDDELGLKYPLTLVMQKVCRQYLSKYPADVDLLWEVEGVGGPYQKVKVASKLASMTLQCNNSSWAAEEGKNGEVAVNEVEMTEESCLDITEDVVVIVNKHFKVAEETNDLPISTRTRSSEHRQKKRPREETEDDALQNQPEKMNRLNEPEAEMGPDAAVPETKEHRDGENRGEQEETSVQVEEALTTEAPATDTEILVAEVNGEISDSQEVDTERSADLLEPEAVIQNGSAEEMEVDREAKDDVIDTLEESEQPSEEGERIGQELIIEEKQEAEAEVAPLEEEEKAAPTVEEEEALTVEEEEAPTVEEEEAPTVEEEEAPTVEEEAEEAAPGVEEESDETAPAVEKESAPVVEEESAPAVEAVEEEAEEEAPSVEEEAAFSVEEAAPAVEEAAPAVEEEAAPTDSEASEEPAVPQQEAPEKTATSPSATGEEEMIIETEGPTMNQEDETASDEPLETEESQPAMEDSEKEVEKLPETDEKDAQKVKEDTVNTEDDDEGKSSDETQDSSPGVRVLRGGRSKPVPPTPKRTSSRLSKAVVVQQLGVEFDEEEEEEKLTSTEEEKGSTEEDEAAEHNSEEEEEPPVIDRRVLRRKTRVIQSTPTKAKRRSKN
ncbi:soluble lamin-associated protein of 75 kDa isoform X2 [Pseudorasbora parva]|uniref:soluble lamin-associated protein of 75 kDa isoform X2 n=1 Tax=Pseudorasbora parva TaxID=51549 RepID=UPI00351E1116